MIYFLNPFVYQCVMILPKKYLLKYQYNTGILPIFWKRNFVKIVHDSYDEIIERIFDSLF